MTLGTPARTNYAKSIFHTLVLHALSTTSASSFIPRISVRGQFSRRVGSAIDGVSLEEARAIAPGTPPAEKLSNQLKALLGEILLVTEASLRTGE